MAEQLTAESGEFGYYLDGLLARLDQGAGWCGVFWQRDPDGMRACREGREVPPWDVVDALLRDLAATYGTEAALAERERARILHAGALTAYDARPGAHDILTRRLHGTLGERHDAGEREAALTHRLTEARTEAEAESLRVDLAWARDDRHRATARCAELRDRLARLPAARPGPYPPAQAAPAPDAGGAPTGPLRARGTRPDAVGVDMGGGPVAPGSAFVGPAAPGREGHAPSAGPAPARPRKRRRGSARFAGLDEDTPAPLVLPGAPAPQDDPDPTPRGARFAGAEAEETRGGDRTEPVPDADDHRAVSHAVAQLAALRAAGRGGEAHMLLAEAARWPAVRFPLLADALTRAGRDADWATLRWEAAALPAGQLVEAAAALESAGRAGEGDRLLREGAARPPEETGAAAARLDAEGRTRDARTLLDACVRARTPEDAARTAVADPGRLAPLLLQAARHVSEEHHRDLLHALRVAGITH
ncbi:hypothetical protein [Streptomyces sp. NBC_01601]|uniref:hypothetical protein n=1 Tax=Streptomyces sp. NBC_01601 TaxID=2975892 RepID=UPI002E2E396A|nr:hypothetical protein [Streptomyces sp. NBC_01601]